MKILTPLFILLLCVSGCSKPAAISSPMTSKDLPVGNEASLGDLVILLPSGHTWSTNEASNVRTHISFRKKVEGDNGYFITSHLETFPLGKLRIGNNDAANAADTRGPSEVSKGLLMEWIAIESKKYGSFKTENVSEITISGIPAHHAICSMDGKKGKVAYRMYSFIHHAMWYRAVCLASESTPDDELASVDHSIRNLK